VVKDPPSPKISKKIEKYFALGFCLGDPELVFVYFDQYYTLHHDTTTPRHHEQYYQVLHFFTYPNIISNAPIKVK
jgi:hypothetical protein